MMRIRDRIFQQFKQTESSEVYAHYKLFRNRVVNETRNIKNLLSKLLDRKQIKYENALEGNQKCDKNKIR